jgi:hypothetical protein
MYKELQYYYDHKDEILQKRKKRYQEDIIFREKCNFSAKMWNMQNKDKRNQISRNYMKKVREKNIQNQNVPQTTESERSF